MNSINILGRLTAAAIPYGSGDKLAARFTVAVPRDRKNADGVRESDFIDCVAFGKLGELVLGYLDKGCRVGVAGRLSVSSYTDKDGAKRRSWSVVCSDVSFCDFKERKTEPEPVQAPAPDPAQVPPGASPACDDVYPF